MAGQDFAKETARVAAGRPKSRSLTPLRGLLPFLRPYRGRIAVALIALATSSAATLVLPQFARGLINAQGLSAEQAHALAGFYLDFVIAAAVLGLASAIRFYSVTWLGERVVADIRKAVFDNVLGLSPEFFEVTRTGEVLSRLTADTTLIQTVVGSSASMAMRNLVTLTGGLALMFVTSFKLALLVVAAVLAVMVPMLIFGRWVRKLSRVSQDSIAETAARGTEVLNAVSTVQAFTEEAHERAEFATSVERSFTIARRRTLARAILTAVAIFTAFASLATVGLIGLHDMIAGRLTGGDLVAFIIYGFLTGGGVGALSEVWGDLQRAAGASERLMELLHAVPAIAAPASPVLLPATSEGGGGAVRFDNVSFHYPSRPSYKALNGFSLDVKQGEAVALVGPSGAGKSTVFQLMLRFFAAQSGTIRFDGVDIAQVDPVALRGRIAVVAQDPVIFSGTIADNIRYGHQQAGDEEVRRAADAAAATEFIERLPDGFNTLVGERGVTLSGGQRQRIAIARAILRDAPLLLLDEATSALDAENERLVQTALANLMVGRTTLVIAHRFATIRRLARIVVMDQGQVVAEGDHDSLMAGGGLYARLARLQFAQHGADEAARDGAP
ncbi:MAG: ABC transporter [Alphaproteobacteria bacterium 64-11]|nr:ATP-binding cassette domain-containing protein [Alphaproteobacteria bacterium]OJU09600.1 MAG: ABC transporter [Alphaproteobacteria bacterium 64-11]